MFLKFSFIYIITTLLNITNVISIQPPGGDIQTDVSYDLVKTGKYGSKLYNIVSTSVYNNVPQLIDLTASTSFQQGYDMGSLLANEFITNYNALMVYLFGDKWYEPLIVQHFNAFIDNQWDNYLSKQLPAEYLDEFEGLTAGGYSVDAKDDIGKIASRGVVITNFPGNLKNLKYIFQDEIQNPPTSTTTSSTTLNEYVNKNSDNDAISSLLSSMETRWKGLTCSMFGVWGTRTLNGNVYTGRNLDWLPDMGVSVYKLITVHHPANGYAHATIGWAGIWGAITGISSAGLSVHEANLESNDTTFRGFPWVLRLRYAMTYAKNLLEAVELWKDTNNTVGFNHGIGSKHDKEAICLETMKDNTAIFRDNDPRERFLYINNQQIGQPRIDAVYRTNHGYDNYTVTHYIDNYNNSVQRYLLFPELFDNYQSTNTTITYIEAINITAIVGNKGEDHPYDCEGDHSNASNILSVAYDLQELIMYTAWENGDISNNTYTPAACNTYLRINMNQWFY